MKKIILFVLLQSVFAFSDCPIHNISIEFRDSAMWSGGNIYSILRSGTKYITDDGYNCEKESAFEKAFLDSNVFLHRQKNTLYIFFVGIEKFGVGDVFRDEFLHWQKCGMLMLTYEDAEGLVAPFVEPLNKLDDAYDEQPESFYIGIDGAPFSYPDQIVKWAKDACAKTSIVQPRKLARADVFFENGLVHVPERLIGQRYFVFDLNGKVIQKGFAGETIRMPNMHSILKVGKEKPTLLRN